jgi:ABC-2 type transport system permease protein
MMYLHVVKTGIQSTLSYRLNFVVRAISGLVPLLATVTLWKTIFSDSVVEVAGYTLAQMVTYYVVVTLVEALTSVTEDDWQIASDIREGQINQFLLRPVNYLHYRLCLFVSGRVTYTIAAALPVVLFLLYNLRYFLLPESIALFFLFVLSSVLAALIQFLLSFITAMLAFWVLEVSTFVFILLALERFASGQLFPLDILPRAATQLLMWTPFPYEMYFPVTVYMGRMSNANLAAGLAMQITWIVILYGAARLLWRKGLKTYAAVGG